MCHIPFKFTLRLSFISYEISLSPIRKIRLNFGNVLAAVTSLFTKQLTKRLSLSILFPISYANLCGTSARKPNAMISPIHGK